MRFPVLPLAAAVLLAGGACTDRSPVEVPGAPALARTSDSIPASGPWARVIKGETGPGSQYELFIPKEWNGGAVYFAHGIRSPLDPVGLDDNQDNFFAVRDALGAMHYAFAYSSFDENGLAEKDGAQRTHQLRGLLNAALPHPAQRNYLAGYSLGALIGLDLAESFPSQYDGLLAMCGMVGGTPLEVQYVGDVRALWDVFYPGSLPGDVTFVPGPPLSRDQVINTVVASIAPPELSPIGKGPMGMFAIASTAQTPLAFPPIGDITDPNSVAFKALVGSTVYALYYQLLAAPDLMDRVHGHTAYDNRGTTYALGTPAIAAAAPMLAAMIAQANANVARYDATPDALNYVKHYYQPTGNLRIPVVTVHNLWDPLVPYLHEAALAQLVQNAGTSDKLLQRAVPNYGHCDQFPTDLVVGSFQTLVSWAETGVKPAN